MCQPGAFLLEHGHSPYEFSYAQDNAWVLKVPGALLRGRLRTPDRYCALSFDASSGAGWLFASYVDLVGQQLGQQLDGGDGPARELAAQQLVDLLVCSVQADARVVQRFGGARRAPVPHRLRAPPPGRPRPDAGTHRAGLRISTRYLHALYRDAARPLSSGCTSSAWTAPRAARRAVSVASVAHQWGFADQSHFRGCSSALWTHAGARAPHRLIRCAAGVTDHASSP